MKFDLNVVYSVILAFTFLTVLRFSVTGEVDGKNPVLRFATNHNWLYPLIIAGPYMLGAFYHDAVPPWPPAAYAVGAAKAGMWAGIATAIDAAIVDIILLWGAATVFTRFAPPNEKRFVKYYYLANFAVGAYLMARFSHLIHINAPVIGG